MNPVAVIVPVKSAGRKSRLSGLLGKAEREEFARLLLADVLHALRGAGMLESCYVVSPDAEMLSLAAGCGAQNVTEPGDEGVNSAVARGLRAVRGPSSVLVLPSDLPLLEAPELRRLLGAGPPAVGAVIAPSRGFDGTNALLFSLASPLPLSYDDNSFWNHLAGAARRGLSVRVCTEPGLMFDVDSAEDFSALARSDSARPSARFARRVLR